MDAVLRKCRRTGLDGPGRQRPARRHNEFQLLNSVWCNVQHKQSSTRDILSVSRQPSCFSVYSSTRRRGRARAEDEYLSAHDCALSVILGNWGPVPRSQSLVSIRGHHSSHTSRRAMTALRPVAWEAWVTEAKVWLRLHPREDHRGVTREERQRSFPKRAAFALVTAAENLPRRDVGVQPCELCGQWTHSWCEACCLCGRSTPFAPCAMPITLYVDHVSVLGGREKRPAPQIPHRPIASNSAATTTRLAGLFRWTHRSASH